MRRDALSPVHAAPSPVQIAAEALRGRWTAAILWSLFWGAKRPAHIARDTGLLSRSRLRAEVRRLERAGLVQRHDLPETPPAIEYGLTDRGRTLRPVLAAMFVWGLTAVPAATDGAALPAATDGAPDPAAEGARSAGAPRPPGT